MKKFLACLSNEKKGIISWNNVGWMSDTLCLGLNSCVSSEWLITLTTVSVGPTELIT